MAISHGGFKRKSKVENEIPNSSLADIAFLLLIFFMVTTVFREEQQRDVEFPDAESMQQVDERRSNIMNVWVEPDGQIFINDQLIPPGAVQSIAGQAYVDTDARLVVSIRGDRDVPYSVINQITEELRDAGALRVNFYTDLEARVTRARR